MGLSVDFNNSGTGFWMESSTGLSVLKTLPDNEAAQGAMNPRIPHRKHADLDLLKEIPDPHPHALTQHAWAKCILVSQFKYNRLVLNDGRRLQQLYLQPEDYMRLSKDPTRGRLALSAFFWSAPQ